MLHKSWKFHLAAAAAATMMLSQKQLPPVYAQAAAASEMQAATDQEAQAPEPLSPDEMEILVARIALYPDELIAAISAASLYPVQIIEAQRFLEDSETRKDIKPKATWDGSVVSLLNYPQILKMMGDDLEWTQVLGEAIANQQKDVLLAIQQLRDRAVAEGIIKTDEKVKVVEENDNIVIRPASAEVVYVPQYAPEMLYEPDYAYAPIAYYPDPYPHYYDPMAPYFAGVVTGVVWAGIVDWDDGFWGGNWDGGDIDINCNKCFNDVDFNGKINLNKVDWKNVDRSKIDFDKTQFNKIDGKKFENSIKANDRNSIKNKSAALNRNRPSTLPASGKQVKDVRASTLDGLKTKPADTKLAKPSQAAGDKIAKPGEGAAGKVGKPSTGGKIDRPVGKPKPAARPDVRPKNPSPIGEINRGKDTRLESNRGAKAMGGGINKPGMGGGGGGHKTVKRAGKRR